MSDISVGAVSVDITPNLRTFFPKVDSETKNMRISVMIEPNLTGFKAKMDQASRDRRLKIKADADTAKAEEQIDHAARDRKVKINASGGSGLSLMAQGLVAAVPLIGPLTAGVAGLGVALGAPLVTTGAALTVGGILTGAAIKQTETQKKNIDALHKSVLAAQQSLSNTQASGSTSAGISSASAQRSAALQMAAAQAQASKTIAAARQAEATATTAAGRASAARAIQTAQATLAARQAAIQTGLSNSQSTTAARTSASQAAAQRKVNEATAAYQAALSGLSPAQQQFITAQGNVKSAFHDLIGANGGALLTPVTTGFDSLARVLPKLGPLIVPVSASVSTLLRDIDRYAQSQGFDRLVNGFGAAAGRDILSFGRDAENVLTGTFGLLKQFGPLSGDFQGWLTGITKDFATFGQGAGSNPQVQQFVSYLREEGPKVAQTLGSVADAVGHIVVALAPLGGVELQGIKLFADTISAIPTGILRTVSFEAAGLFLVMKGANVLDSASTAFGKLSVSLGKLSGAGGKLSVAQTAIRGFAGAAGLGLITAGASTSNKALGILAEAGGGAVLGFSLGGPIGAAIGAGAGALVGLATHAHQATVQFDNARPVLGDYADSLDAVTGKITALTKSEAFQTLYKAGAIQAGKQVGLSPQTLVNAALGNKQDLTQIHKLNTDAFVNNFGGYTNAQREALLKINDTVDANAKKFAQDAAKQRDFRQATLDLTTALQGFPKAVITKIGLDGFPSTSAQVATLAEKYKLTPRQIKTLLSVSNVQSTVRNIELIKRAADQAAKPRLLKFNVQAELAGLKAGSINLTASTANDLAKPVRPPGHAAGGLISGIGTGTSDSNLVAVSRGEFVQRKAAVDYYGAPFMAALNEGRLKLSPAAGLAPSGQRQGGDIHNWTFTGDIRPNDFQEFKRQMDEERRHAAYGGIPV